MIVTTKTEAFIKNAPRYRFISDRFEQLKKMLSSGQIDLDSIEQMASGFKAISEDLFETVEKLKNT